MPKVSESVDLSFVLPGDEGALFPRAILEDNTGAIITGSPVDLTHTSNGRYIGSFTMPAKDVYVNYIAYSDADHTVKDPLFDQGHEVIELELIDLIDIDNKIVGIISETLSADLLDDGLLEATLEDFDTLTATIEDCETLTVIK